MGSRTEVTTTLEVVKQADPDEVARKATEHRSRLNEEKSREEERFVFLALFVFMAAMILTLIIKL